MRRGELWEANAPGPREVVIVSRDSAIPYLPTVTVALVTRSPERHVAEVELSAADGAPDVSAANCDLLFTLPKDCLVRPLGMLGRNSSARLDDALRVALGLD